LPEDYWDWTATTYLICFDKVEWHPTDRVMLQFGLPQEIPGPPRDMRQFHKLDKRFKTWYESNGFRFPEECEHWDNRRRYTLPRMRPRPLTPTHAYIEWLTTTCNPRLTISVVTKPSNSDPDPDIEQEPERQPEIHNNQTPIHDDFWDQDIFSQLQDHQSQPHTTQNTQGSVMYEFLDTPQQNIIQPPPYTSPRNAYEPHYQSNYGYNDPNQASTSNTNYFSYNDPNQAGPSNTNYPPYNNPQYPMYTNQNYNYPPTPTNLLSHFSPASINSNEQFLDMGWPTREHDVSLSLGYGSQIQPTTDNNDEDQHDSQVNRGRNRRRRGCGTGGHL
jgi:hypothetical protein